MKGVGRRYHHRIDIAGEKPLQIGVKICDPVACADRGPHRRRCIGQPGEAESFTVFPEVEGMFGLGDKARSHQAYPQFLH